MSAQAEADRVSLRTAVDALQEQQRVLSLRLRRNAVQSSLEDGPDGGDPTATATDSPAAADSDSDAVAAATTAAATTASEPTAAASSTAETTTTTGGDERAQAMDGAAPDAIAEEGPSMPRVVQEEEEEEETLALRLPPSSMDGTVAPEAAFSRLARLLEGPATIGVEQMSIVESIHECVILPPALWVYPYPRTARDKGSKSEAREGGVACGAASGRSIDICLDHADGKNVFWPTPVCRRRLEVLCL